MDVEKEVEKLSKNLEIKSIELMNFLGTFLKNCNDFEKIACMELIRMFAEGNLAFAQEQGMTREQVIFIQNFIRGSTKQSENKLGKNFTKDDIDKM